MQRAMRSTSANWAMTSSGRPGTRKAPSNCIMSVRALRGAQQWRAVGLAEMDLLVGVTHQRWRHPRIDKEEAAMRDAFGYRIADLLLALELDPIPAERLRQSNEVERRIPGGE